MSSNIEELSTIMREFYDLQKLRISTNNRLRTMEDKYVMQMISTNIEMFEDALGKSIMPTLRRIPIYHKFLAGIKGCGPLMSGSLISEIGREHKNGMGIAAFPNISKLWKYSGLAPREVYKSENSYRYNWFLKMSLLGEQKMVDQFVLHKHPYGYSKYQELKKRMRAKHPYKEVRYDNIFIQSSAPAAFEELQKIFHGFEFVRMGNVTKGSGRAAILVDEAMQQKIEGMKVSAAEKEAATEGEDEPAAETGTKVAVQKVIMDSIGQALGPGSVKVVWGKSKVSWNDGHIDNMAKKELGCLFLRHLWVKWRTMEGLPVTSPYVEQFMGHTNIEDNPDVWVDKPEKLS